MVIDKTNHNIRQSPKRKKIQIEPFRGAPGLSTAKDYVRTTKILAQKLPKVVEKKKVKLWLETECNDCTKKEKEFLNGGGFIMKAPIWYDPLKVMEYRGWYGSGSTDWEPKSSAYLKYTTRRFSKKHEGLDLYASIGTTAYACVEGTVYINYFSSTYGNCFGIKGEYNGKLLYFFYAHLNKEVKFKIGEYIKIGELIGETGVTGNANKTDSKKNHLHFEVRNTTAKTGGRLNPFIEVPEILKNFNIYPDKTTQK